jgi:phosphatidylglycerophosphatase C
VNLALFDFDGTITTDETFGAFVRYATPATRLAIGKLALAPLVLGYRLGVVPGPSVRSQVVRFGFRGLPAIAIHEAGHRFYQAVLPALVRPEALARVAWHKAQGDTIVVVSGSFDCYLTHWAEEQQVDLLCSSLEVGADGRLTGRYHGAQCVGPEKVRRVRQRYDLSSFEEIFAYGDTKEDLAMLRVATKRIYRWKEAA